MGRLFLLVVALFVSYVSLVSGQSVTLNSTNPIVGNIGGSVEFVCTVSSDLFGGNPANIVLLRGGSLEIFTDPRITSGLSDNARVYTFRDLERSDNGITFVCGVQEYKSPIATLQVNFLPEIAGFSGPLVVDGVVTLMAGESTTINFTVDGGPAPINTIQLSPSSSNIRVPSSLSVSGNTVIVDSVDRSDGGTYLLISTNSLGSTQIEFSIVVEFAPIFTDMVSEEFLCDTSVEPIFCASRVSESGSFRCDFQSNPEGTLNSTFDVPDDTGIELVGSRIVIGSVILGNVGNYSCIASNIIQGVERVAVRSIRFIVGDAPAAVDNGTATVNNITVIITWTHTQQQEAIPISGFTVVGGPISATSPTFSVSVGADVFRVVLGRGMLDDATDYRATIKAMDALGEGDGRDVTFRIPATTPTLPSVTPSKGHTYSVKSVSCLLSVTVILVFTLHL